jgi:hypothetical protein
MKQKASPTSAQFGPLHDDGREVFHLHDGARLQRVPLEDLHNAVVVEDAHRLRFGEEVLVDLLRPDVARQHHLDRAYLSRGVVLDLPDRGRSAVFDFVEVGLPGNGDVGHLVIRQTIIATRRRRAVSARGRRICVVSLVRSAN